MATVEQQLGARLRRDGVLRIPVPADSSRYGDMNNSVKAAGERMRRIIGYARCEADVEFDPEKNEIKATKR